MRKMQFKKKQPSKKVRVRAKRRSRPALKPRPKEYKIIDMRTMEFAE
jgi:hypothetical protein